MNVTIENVGSCKKILKFEIPKETLDDEFEKKTKEVCSTVELPGFRKGHAPRKLVEKRFVSQIKDEVKQTVVSESYQKALEEHKLNPVGNPSFGEIKMEMGQPLNFDVTLEVWPSFEIGQYKGFSLKKKVASVTDEDVEMALKDLSLRKAQLTVIKDGKVKKSDTIICDIKVDVGKNNVFEDDDVEIFVSNGIEIVNTAIPDLVAKLEGVGSGDECDLDVKLSERFLKEGYRGKDATIKIKVKEIKRPVFPDINEDFAKTMGFESLEDLKLNICKRLEFDKKNRTEDDLRNQLFDVLLEHTNFELPQDFVNYHTEQRVYKYQLNLLNRGVPLDEIQKQTEKIKNASEESVIREMKVSLIIERIAEKERIFVTESEVEQRIADIARAYNKDILRVRRQLERQGNLSYLRSEMRQDKVISYLMKEARIET